MTKLAVVRVPAALTEGLVIVIPGIAPIVPLPMLAPAILTGTVRPRKPEAGGIEVSAGGPLRTLKLEPAVAALAPFAVATVMLQGPSGPTGLMVNDAVICVRLSTVTLPGVMAGQAETTTPGRKLVPVMTTVWVE